MLTTNIGNMVFDLEVPRVRVVPDRRTERIVGVEGERS